MTCSFCSSELKLNWFDPDQLPPLEPRSQNAVARWASRIITRLNKPFLVKQTYNFAYRLSFNCSVFFLIGFVCECFFVVVVDTCYLRSNFEASLVLPTTQRLQLKTDEINSFVINTAAYLKQKSHFNGDNWLGIAWDIRCFQKWTKGRGSFLWISSMLARLQHEKNMTWVAYF